MPAEPSSSSVTADDVAELAGVSRWTVNRAFKKDASISEKSRSKVLEAAEALGYAPDLLAASLASQNSNLIALVIDDFTNPHHLVMLENITRALRQNGYETLLVNALDAHDAPGALLTASQRRVDASVLIGTSFTDQVLTTALGARRVKRLILFGRASGRPEAFSICVDDRKAMSAMSEHVIARGYRRPVFLAGPQSTSAYLARKDIFVEHWQAHAGWQPEILPVGIYDPSVAAAHVVDFLAQTPVDQRPDVFVCETDALAIGAIDAVRDGCGLSVPGDIAVTGFDDVPLAASPSYRLTTVRQPMAEMADGLVKILLGEASEHRLDKFIGEIIVRAST